MSEDEQKPPDTRPTAEIEARIVGLRDAGMPWNEIQGQFNLSRQQARHAYQRGKRTERRAARRNPNP